MIKSQIKIEGKNDRILTLEKDSIKGLDKFEFNVAEQKRKLNPSGIFTDEMKWIILIYTNCSAGTISFDYNTKDEADKEYEEYEKLLGYINN